MLLDQVDKRRPVDWHEMAFLWALFQSRERPSVPQKRSNLLEHYRRPSKKDAVRQGKCTRWEGRQALRTARGACQLRCGAGFQPSLLLDAQTVADGTQSVPAPTG